MGSRTIWAIAGGLVVVVVAITLLEVSPHSGEAVQERGDVRPGQDARSSPAASDSSSSVGDPGVEELQVPVAERDRVAHERGAALDPPRETAIADPSGIDHETGWTYRTRMRAEQALYEALDTPEMRGAAYVDQLACGEGKCRFELALVQPLSSGNAQLVSDFMADLDARLLADSASSGVQVYLEKFSPRTDGTGLAVLIIDSRAKSPATISIDEETGSTTIRFPGRPDGGG